MNLHIRDVEERARLLQSLKTESEDIKNRLVAVSARCHELENIQPSELQVYKPTSDVDTVQELLRDALEKNQQWLAYDQQREAYVTAVLARIYQLEQQQSGTSVGIQQQQHKGPDSKERSCPEAQGQYEKALKSCEEQLKQELHSVAQAQAELGRVKREVHDRKEELCQVQTHTQEKQVELDQLRLQIKETNGDRNEIQDLLCCKWTELEQLQKEIQVKQCELDQVQHQIRDKHCEISQMHQQVKDQKRELNKGVQLQEVLHEKQTRIAVLEKQVTRFAEDVETQTCEKQHLQRHLDKVLKDLSKAQEYISKLEDELDKAQSKTGTFEEITRFEKHVQSLKGSPRVSNPLDESFLECPNCRLQYPTSRHRELVIHIDKCFG